MLTDADNFCIECQLNFFKFKIKFLLNFKYLLEVPPDLNIKSKSTLLGALFLIVIFFWFHLKTFCLNFSWINRILCFLKKLRIIITCNNDNYKETWNKNLKFKIIKSFSIRFSITFWPDFILLNKQINSF
jgi:hypothetical protein